MGKGPGGLAALCRKYNVEILYAFGSHAREAQEMLGGHRTQLLSVASDLDIGARIHASLKITVREKVSLAIDLEECFVVPRVDLVLFSEADPFLAANIVRGERLYCMDPHDADEYELYILRRAGDLAPLEHERLSLLEHS
jgi:predicted nucleotidyltransferase